MSYHVTFKLFSPTVEQFDSLAKKWQTLELGNSYCTFFITWAWIGTWLKQAKSAPLWLLEARCEKDNAVVGLAIFTQKKIKRFGCIPITQLFLHKSGDAQLDQAWIEYNDFMLRAEDQNTIREAMFAYLTKQTDLIWHELHWHMHLATLPFQLNKTRFQQRLTLKDCGFIKKLSSGHDCLTQFSKNTRQQVKRSLKLLQQQGQLTLQLAKTAAKKQLFLNRIGQLHQVQWTGTQWGSGFDNPYFVDFHQTIIQDPHSELLSLTLNGQVIAYSYNYCHHNKVNFYLSAMVKDDDNRIKVGHVLHYLAMEHYRQLGYTDYDFLAGEARYKKSLSDNQYVMQSSCFYRLSTFLKLENRLRNFKQFIKKKVASYRD